MNKNKVAGQNENQKLSHKKRSQGKIIINSTSKITKIMAII